MAFEEVKANFATPWPGPDAKVGQAISGIYAGTDEIPSPGGERGETFTSYRVETDDGEVFGVSGAVLKNLFAQIKVGSTVRVTVTELQHKFASGMRGKFFSVEVDRTVKLAKPKVVTNSTEEVPF